jgi:hypothetical protein
LVHLVELREVCGRTLFEVFAVDLDVYLPHRVPPPSESRDTCKLRAYVDVQPRLTGRRRRPRDGRTVVTLFPLERTTAKK